MEKVQWGETWERDAEIFTLQTIRDPYKMFQIWKE